MASASVVGQRPGQHTEPPLFVYKVSGVRKKISPPRRVSREGMLFRRSGGECGAVPAQPDPGCAALSPAAAGDAAPRGGQMPGDGCAAAPRRSDPGGEEEDNTERDRQARETHTDNVTSHRDSDRGAGARRSCVGAVRSDACAHRAARRHRDAPHGGSGLPLERLTQARSGVVRLVRPEPSRREAWSIFTQDEDPRVRTERGEGHRFEAKAVTQDWCDACSCTITAQALTCQNCSYTCHLECQRRVQLDCNQRDRQSEKSPSPRVRCSSTPPRCKQNETKEEEGGGKKDLSAEEVKTRIEAYNAQVSENGMKLASDGSYTGFIKVHLRLSRPVTVSAVEALSSDEGHSQAPPEEQEEVECKQNDKRTSFYLPCDCVKHLHISSQTTTSEVIQSLLKKFMVLDNPRKFALYKQTHRDGQDLFQKLPLCEHPLLLRLIAGPDPEQLSFVLKENETGEVEWHAFSLPELQNFLVILEKEEAERVRAVEQKYAVYRRKLQQALQQHDP